MDYTQNLIIDGVVYKIPLVSISRNGDFLEKYANRTEDGNMNMETIGFYKNYTITIGTLDDPEEYDRLYEHISDTENRFHTVVLPDASKDFVFTGYFSSIKDEVLKCYGESTQYKGLTWKMTSRKPYK